MNQTFESTRVRSRQAVTSSTRACSFSGENIPGPCRIVFVSSTCNRQSTCLRSKYVHPGWLHAASAATTSCYKSRTRKLGHIYFAGKLLTFITARHLSALSAMTLSGSFRASAGVGARVYSSHSTSVASCSSNKRPRVDAALLVCS